MPFFVAAIAGSIAASQVQQAAKPLARLGENECHLSLLYRAQEPQS
jgi:hypothetical protein